MSEGAASGAGGAIVTTGLAVGGTVAGGEEQAR
jgi:hypothetical protein